MKIKEAKAFLDLMCQLTIIPKRRSKEMPITEERSSGKCRGWEQCRAFLKSNEQSLPDWREATERICIIDTEWQTNLKNKSQAQRLTKFSVTKYRDKPAILTTDFANRTRTASQMSLHRDNISKLHPLLGWEKSTQRLAGAKGEREDLSDTFISY